MELHIDCREKRLYESCLVVQAANEKLKGITLFLEELTLGDIVIKEAGETLLILERKSIPDLISSIKDKRYEEQSFRLNDLSHPNHNIVYLLEGDMRKYTKDKQMIYSSWVSLHFFKGFSVFRTMDMNETAFLALHFSYKIGMEREKGKHGFYCDSVGGGGGGGEKPQETSQPSSIIVKEQGHQEPVKSYCSMVVKKKSSYITPENIGEIMLCQIPNVSEKTAVAIMKKCNGSLSNLITNLKENPRFLDGTVYGEEKETNVKNIKNGEDDDEEEEVEILGIIFDSKSESSSSKKKKGATKSNSSSLRKISKKSIENIISYLIKP